MKSRRILLATRKREKAMADHGEVDKLGLEGIRSSRLIVERPAMSWKDRAIRLYKRFGAPAKFAAKMILSAVVPGGPAVVQLVGEVLDCVHETAKDNLSIDEKRLPSATPADFQRVEEILDVLNGSLEFLMAQVVALADVPQAAQEAVDTALLTDLRCRDAVRRIDNLARRFDRLEQQNRKLLQGQGYATGMLEEMLPLMRRIVGVADYFDDLCKAGIRAADFQSCLHEFQDAARAFGEGGITEAVTGFQKAAQSQPQSAAAATALAGAKAVGQDFHATERFIARAARLRPDDAELAELHRRVTAASRGATPREQHVPREASRQPRKVGDTLDGWRLDLLLGHGGWGRVFKASRGSEVRALKVMHEDLSRDPLFVERFKKEILTLASLRGHKHLIAIDNFGYAAEAACWYFVMELIEGMSLERYLQKRGALTVAQARPLFLAVADGLAAAHARGIIHRDIKPANILLRRDGTSVLVDFGLATVADDKGLTQTGRSAGYSAMFAAPEQLRGKPADARSDIYSLAASLYYALLYDKPEYREPDQFEAEQAPAELRTLLTNALQARPERRLATVASFCDGIRAGSSIHSGEINPTRRAENTGSHPTSSLKQPASTSSHGSNSGDWSWISLDPPKEPPNAAQAPSSTISSNKSIRKIALTGRYIGEKRDVWGLEAVLEIVGNDVRGRIRWELLECPPELPWAKRLNGFGFEFVRGTLEVDCLNLRGYKVDDKTLLIPSVHTFVLSSDWRTFEGTTFEKSYKGSLRGSVRLEG